MPKICYVHKHFASKSQNIISQANEIISEYASQGFDLTLRQLYYQFVARDLIPNRQSEYKRLGSIINDARLAGLIDWNRITDRTRNLQKLSHWDSPAELVDACAQQYHVDRWKNQEYRPEVWIEKDALVGVIADVCEDNDIPYFSCRGYTSQSEMWSAAMRLREWIQEGQKPIIFHLGDHDPSGIDMTRDIDERLELFIQHHEEDAVDMLEVRRIALLHEQVEEYSPPPNPAKMADSRFEAYALLFGEESWELDALEPMTMVALIESHIETVRDEEKWEETGEEQAAARALLQQKADELREE